MRYLVLVALNLPIIFLALLNIITQYKLGKVDRRRFLTQVMLWLVILTILVGSFPLYNYFIHRPILDSIALSSFDIIQTTVLVYLIYILVNQRRKIEQTERRMRDLHQELSIRLSEVNSYVTTKRK